METNNVLRPISFSGDVKSISDDDLCAECGHCDYQPGEMSGCKLNWPGQEDADGYVRECKQLSTKQVRTVFCIALDGNANTGSNWYDKEMDRDAATGTTGATEEIVFNLEVPALASTEEITKAVDDAAWTKSYTPIPTPKPPVKPLTYGDSNAIMVIAAERMGLSPSLVDEAVKLLKGGAIHAMTSAAISKEACRMNDLVRHDPVLIAQANSHVEVLMVEHGFVERLLVTVKEHRESLRTALVQAIEASGFSISGPTDIRAAEDGEPIWVCNGRALLADTAFDWQAR